ncbi:hypothetical protein BDN72DRAFT_851286 [Pluteus cervinus]|uniref:Uncharacterized protein n=1 Tax=Pluteus cervinus TaxID=181527 RepID=A0ACD3A174_9AGAR|nr:hypothetical protein BDN72DRAFT_851286 [Pluteus cervinus]
MQLTFLSAILLAAYVVPAALADTVPGGNWLCPQTNWGGVCEDIVFGLGVCQISTNVISGGVLGSIGPNKHTVCFGFNSDSCIGNLNWGFAYPGDSTAGVSSGNPWGNHVKSIVCYETNVPSS